MSNETTIPSPASRDEALSAIWRILVEDHPEDGQIHLASTQEAPPNAIQLTNNAFAYKIVKRGISSRAVGPLSEFLGLNKGVVVDYLDMDRGTANRRAQKDQLLPTHAAEGVLRLLGLDQMAVDTFESEQEASRWLRKPHPMLEGETPLEAAKTSFGAERAKDILLTIKYGGVV